MVWLIISLGFVLAIGNISQWLFFRFVKKQQARINEQNIKRFPVIHKHWGFVLIFVFLFSFMGVNAQYDKGFVVTVTTTNKEKLYDFDVYRLKESRQVDSLINWNLGWMLPEFRTAEAVKHTKHFQLLTDNCTIYVEQQLIVGYRKDGTLKMKKIKN